MQRRSYLFTPTPLRRQRHLHRARHTSPTPHPPSTRVVRVHLARHALACAHVLPSRTHAVRGRHAAFSNRAHVRAAGTAELTALRVTVPGSRADLAPIVVGVRLLAHSAEVEHSVEKLASLSTAASATVSPSTSKRRGETRRYMARSRSRPERIEPSILNLYCTVDLTSFCLNGQRRPAVCCGKDNAPNPHGCTCTSGYSIESATARCERGETRRGVHKAKPRYASPRFLRLRVTYQTEGHASRGPMSPRLTV